MPPFSAAGPPVDAGSFVADLHIHSKYSRACSRDLDLPNLAWWARRKGIALLGTGDFTHPALVRPPAGDLRPAEPGLFRLSPEAERDVARRLPPRLTGAEARPVRFMLSVEISTIYKRDDRTRKVHHLIYLPDLDAVARFNAGARAGSATSARDGRPILGLDSRDLLEITLEASPDGYLVPAHIWTPWFSALGSKSGFDAIADCYADLAEHIFAVETGLSSDPAMNWRVVQPGPVPAGVQLGRSLPAGAGPGGDRASPPRSTTSRSGRRCAPATGCTARSSSSPRRASTTPTGTGPAASTGRRSRPGRPAAGAPSAASR